MNFIRVLFEYTDNFLSLCAVEKIIVMEKSLVLVVMAAMVLLPCCEELDDDPEKYLEQDEPLVLPLDDVASLLSEIPIGEAQVGEVYDAVTSSSWNGYDEEYMMTDLFREPGAGVGDDRLPETAMAARREAMRKAGVHTRSSGEYDEPLKDLIEKHLKERTKAGSVLTRADGTEITADEYLAALKSSDIQIYWPYSENWDKEEFPVITFDPDDGGSTNTGYRLSVDSDGNRTVEEVIVDETMAMEHPVWVVNRNDDSGYSSLELLRMQEPEWGNGGGEIIINPHRSSGVRGVEETGRSVSGDTPVYMSAAGRAAGDVQEDDGTVMTLVLKDFTMLRNFDSWFAGASEFFVKVGSVEDFSASTEAELKLYSPSVTDFMIVVKRKYVGVPQKFNAVLVSDWTEQLTHCALIISEDDGGTKTSWKCSAVVKIKSRSYGFDIDLPINTRDDIVWRGQLSRKYIIANNGQAGHFGDVDLTFEIMEY